MINNERLNDEWGFSSRLYDFNNKERCVRYEIEYMIMRCLEMFRYENLPDTIDKRNLELWLQCGGAVCITDKPDGVLRVFFGSLGAGFDPNYRPLKFIIANPYLNYDAELDIVWESGQEGDCVVIRNDSLYRGMMPLHRKYASMRVENELSLKVADILSRMPTILKADDEETRKSAQRFLENILEGKLGIVLDESFEEGLQDVQLTNQMHMLFHGLIEYEQYIRSSWFGELGLNSMFNLKREAVSDAEKSMNEDELLPLIDNMLEERKRAVELINEKYGTNIEVKFNSSWEDNIKEIELEQDIMEAEADGSDGDTSGSDDNAGDEDVGANAEEESTDGKEGVSGEQSNDAENSETDSDDSGADEGDNINVEVNININSDDNEESNVEEEKDDDREDS